MSSKQAKAILEGAFNAAVAKVTAYDFTGYLPEPGAGRTLVLGAGKAAAGMAAALDAQWPAELEGEVVTRYGHTVPNRRIQVTEARHPTPDDAGEAAARRFIEAASQLTEDDLLIVLLSGGASSLLPLPFPGLTLANKQALTRALLASGAQIEEINCVRKHLSQIKGGRLAAAAHPAQVITLAVSDVVGDDPAVIGSGPTTPDPTTLADARGILARYSIDADDEVARALNTPANESPDEQFWSGTTHIVATPMEAIDAAAGWARVHGVTPISLGDAFEGDIDAAVAAHIDKARNHDGPTLLISGGELTVNLKGDGVGGPNTEFALRLAVALEGNKDLHALIVDTDGSDGSGDNAGAFITPDTLARANALDLNAADALSRNDTYPFFEQLGDLLITGPTQTNVNDLRLLLIASPEQLARLS